MKIAILGAGRSGRSAAKLARLQGHDVEIFDISSKASSMEEIPVTAGAKKSDAERFSPDLVVLSPGIEPESEFVKYFTQHAKLVGEIEFASWFYQGKIVAITGTNGKTTTTELVAKIFNTAGISCEPCGNYGVPFSDIVMQDSPPAVVALEVSSFQLETVEKFHPDVAIWLNFAPDHMDRYSSVEEYYQAKLHIFDQMQAKDFAVVREGENLPELPMKMEIFSTQSKISDLYFDSNLQQIFYQNQAVLDLKPTKLRGLHNAENVMAAAAACHQLGVNWDQIALALSDYAPPAHRCELIAIWNGVEYLNDSKATNLHALEAALRSQIAPVVLIAGGKEKGLDYSPLGKILKEKVKHCVVFGQIKEKLAGVFQEFVSVEIADSLQEAVLRAKESAKFGDVVLFSPGTSSFDMFSGYEERGEAFRKIVLAIR